MFAPSLTVEAWIRPQDSGIRTIISRAVECVSVLTIHVDESGCVKAIGNNAEVADVKVLETDIWVYITLSLGFDSSNGETVVTFYQNGLQTYSKRTGTFHVWDRYSTTALSIGMKERADFFKGFIWSLSLHNSIISAEEIAGRVKAESCSSGLPFCLSTASFLETVEGEACLFANMAV